MKETNQRVATLEKNIVLLLNKLKDNHYAITSLRSQLEESKSQAQALIEENTALKSENDSLTVANSLLGSNESNATTKHKINTLIEQVRCMYQPVTRNGMSELLKIKLTIADRVYPLSVAPEQEEALRSSAKKIEAMIKQLEQSYAVRDKQDVLAMCALQYATQVEQNRKNEKESTAVDTATLDHLNQMIQEHMATF